MTDDFLNNSLLYSKGVGPARAEILAKELGITTVMDMLNHFPYRFEDRRTISKVSQIDSSLASIQLIGKIERIYSEGSGKAKRLKAILYDNTGSIELIWFQGQTWVEKKLNINQVFFVYGKPAEFKGFYNIVHPEIEVFDPVLIKKEQRIKPIYHLTDLMRKRMVDSKALSQITYQIIHDPKFSIQEYLPKSILDFAKLIPLKQAYYQIHHPNSQAEGNQAVLRLKFNELFDLQMRILLQKQSVKKDIKGVLLHKIGPYFNQFYDNYLSFDLTNAQKKVIKEIRLDVKSGRQMNRLLQGDVGSGKTMVAWFTMLMAADNGYQSCLMAPTEILAQQHAQSLAEEATKLGLKLVILTGATKTKERRLILEQIKSGEAHFIVGTHALIEDTVIFHQLGISIIDEQHRFGVSQRAKLWATLAQPPHVMVMTATPIPRTLAMTVYGDLDVSVIDEMPPGRIPTKTLHKFKHQFVEVATFIRNQIELGKQAYIVYPLINESEKLDYQDLMSAYDEVARFFPTPQFHISLLHGKLKPQEKEQEMKRFKEGKTQIMMATTVIEVGVNVPNATVMVIENAERFGLSQLHQLRGRVGRSNAQAYCILITGKKVSDVAKKRIEALASTTNGFELAALDLKLRGPGDIDGTQQSGLLDLKLSDLVKDEQVLILARKLALDIIHNDADLLENSHQELKKHLKNIAKGKVWRRIS